MKEDFTEEEILKLTITQFLKISISSQVPKKLVDQLVDQILDQRNDELKSQIIQDQKKKDAIQLQETVINNLFDKLKNYEVIKEESIILQQEELRRFMYEDLNEAINEYILTYKETNKCKKIVESFKFNLDDYFKTQARRPNDIWNNSSKENYLKSEKTFEQEKKKDFGTVDKNGKKSPITKIEEDLNLLFMIICLISLLIRKLHLPDKLKKIIGEKSPNKKSNKTPK